MNVRNSFYAYFSSFAVFFFIGLTSVNAWSGINLNDTDSINDYYLETGMSSLLRQQIYSCTSGYNCSTKFNVLDERSGMLINNTNYSNIYGLLYGFATDTALEPDKIYSIAIDFCTFGGTISNINTDMNLFSGGLSNSNLVSYNKIYHGTYVENNKYVMLGTISNKSNSCYRDYYVGSGFDGVALKPYYYINGRNITKLAILGYKIAYLGDANNLSTSDVSNIVNNAVNNSTNSINQNINEMNNNIKQEIQESTDKVNNTITDSTVDSDAITSLNGTDLPTNGALSAILNMPVQFFSTLLNQLDASTCKSSIIPLPYVNYSFELTCGRSLLNDLGALDFYELIGTLAGGLAIFNYLIYMGKQMKKMQDLEDGGGEFGGI